jgi:hypothetical protein
MNRMKALGLASTTAACLAAAPGVLAGTATLSSADGGSATFEYNATMLRIGTADADGYSVLRDGNLYVVSTAGGEPIVMDAGAMLRSFGNMGSQMGANAAPSELAGEFISLDDTGRKETVAGVKGEVYTLRFRDDTGSEQTEEIVLSDDARAREFRDALFLMLSVVATLGAPETAAADASIQARLMDIDKGILRFGDQMQVTAIDAARVDDSRFELPAEPMQMDGIADMVGAMGAGSAAQDAGDSDSNSGGGLFSGMMGALGGKVDRQADRVGDSVEDEIDKETDESVDKAIGKAFGKLFRR